MTTTDCEPQKIIMKSCLDTSRRWYEELWPQMPDGSPWDGLNLLSLVRSGASPFEDVFDVNLLIQEVEEATQAQIVDVPEVIEGISHYVSIYIPVDLGQSFRRSTSYILVCFMLYVP